VTQEDIAAIAQHLGLPVAEVRRRCVRKVGRRYSLTERPGNKDCIFLAPDGAGGRKCRIYPVRPAQCRTWPFWPSNLSSPAAWAAAGDRCKGINRGRLYNVDEIRTRHNATEE